MAPTTTVSRRIHSQPKTPTPARASTGGQGKPASAQKAPAAHAQPIPISPDLSNVGDVEILFPDSFPFNEPELSMDSEPLETKHRGGNDKDRRRTPSRFKSPDKNLQLYQYSDLPRIGRDRLERAGRQLYNAAYDDNIISAREAATLYARFGQAYFSVPDASRNRNQRALDYILDNSDGRGDELFEFDNNQTKRNFRRMLTLFGLGADPEDTGDGDPSFGELQDRLNAWASRYKDLRNDVRRLDDWVSENVYDSSGDWD